MAVTNKQTELETLDKELEELRANAGKAGR